jgi:uncharacterized repeat protein (TIGR03803 family)
MSPDGKCVILVTFDGGNGSHPSSLIQGKDGNFYGTTLQGGPSGDGSVFKMTRNGAITTLATFGDYLAGYGPGGLIQGSDGSLYGSVSREATKSGAFKLTLSGELTTPFTNRVPADDRGDLLKARDGNSYGTTFADRGDGTSQFGYGTVYKVSPSGERTTLIAFSGTNGANPLGKLVQGRDGNLYGIATAGGTLNQGTVFRLNLATEANSTSRASAQVNVPVLIHAVSNKVDPRIMDAMQSPIAFFGKVVDEKSNVLSSANVAFRWTDLLARGFECTSTAQSDSNGLFSLRDKQGSSLAVSVGKDGYYGTHSSQQTFKYSKMEGDARHTPDSQNPVVFQLRTKGKGEQLLERDFPPGMGQITQLRHDGTPIEIDLFESKKVAPGSGQLKLEFWRDTSEKNARTFDWKLQLSISGGGLHETDEEFPLIAPERVFQPSILINMPKTNQNWRSDLRSRYYIHLPDGKYGRVEFYLLPYNGVFRVKSTINPSGSRNLEPDH